MVRPGHPLFSGQAGSGRVGDPPWIPRERLARGIVALPDQMFRQHRASYVWISPTTKADEDRGTVKLIDARNHGTKMRKSSGATSARLSQTRSTES